MNQIVPHHAVVIQFFVGIINEYVVETSSVSYTHLDVYKRQLHIITVYTISVVSSNFIILNEII